MQEKRGPQFSLLATGVFGTMFGVGWLAADKIDSYVGHNAWNNKVPLMRRLGIYKMMFYTTTLGVLPAIAFPATIVASTVGYKRETPGQTPDGLVAGLMGVFGSATVFALGASAALGFYIRSGICNVRRHGYFTPTNPLPKKVAKYFLSRIN